MLTLGVAPLAPALLGLAGLAGGALAPAGALTVALLGGLAVAATLALRLRAGAPPGDGAAAASELTTVTSEAEEARRLAEQATRERDRVFSFVSHELRSPLHAMHAWLSILASSTDETTRRRAVDVLERNLSLQSRLVEDLLDASRITTGKLHLERRPCDLAQIVQLVFRGERLVAEEQGIELTVDCVEQAPVDGDFERLQQAVGNLVSNAIKFTDEGGRIHVALVVEDGTAVVRVEDSGRGISAEALPHVFDAYEQERPAVSDEAAGLGLGLAIVAMVVQEHGGTASAHSDGRGRGARFELRLPVVEADGRPEPSPEPSPDVLEGLRVLIVDANRGSAEALALTLEEAGAVVDWARNPTAARAAAAAEMPDVLVCGAEEAQATSLLKELRAGQPKLRSLALLDPRSGDLRSRLRRAGFEVTARRALPPAEIRGRMIRLLGRQPSVLVVDDDRDSADSLALLLERRGFEVAVAYGFAEALRVAQSIELDLVVTDVSLPDGDGPELARRLRFRGARRIVAVSGFSRDEVDPDGECFDGFVRKPVDLDALLGSLAGD